MQQEAIVFPPISEQAVASSLVQSWEEMVLCSLRLSPQLQKGLGEIICTVS